MIFFKVTGLRVGRSHGVPVIGALGSLTDWVEEAIRISGRPAGWPEGAAHAHVQAKEQKHQRAHGGCLGTERRRRTCKAAISRGELQRSCDPRISEWDNPQTRLRPGANAPN
jgi:hypothetical protein